MKYKIKFLNFLLSILAVFLISNVAIASKIDDNTLRIHFKKLPSDDISTLGLWSWDDVKLASEKKGSWPNGADSFKEAKKDDFGYYMDLEMIPNAKKVSFLINNTKGDNLTGDKNIEIISPLLKEIYLDENNNIFYYKPLEKGTLRINYTRSDKNYDKKSLWIWGNVDESISKQLGDWPNGIDFVNRSSNAVYMDIKLSDFNEIGLLLLDESKQGDDAKIQKKDYNFKDLKSHTQIFLKDNDETIYTNPFFVNDLKLLSANLINQFEIELIFNNLKNIDEKDILKDLKIFDKDNKEVKIENILLEQKLNKVTIKAKNTPFKVKFIDKYLEAKINWQYKDFMYSYDGKLGADVLNNGKKVSFKLWSPSANLVSVIIYDKNDDNKEIFRHKMEKSNKGLWNLNLEAAKLGLKDLRGYYYHYEIKRDGKDILVLDPYAKSMAAWNSNENKVAKAAIVDVKNIGIKNLKFAKIPNFKKREDAIIYEIHIRDFTSDPNISKELKNQFGTFAAFVEKLDYIKELGVTHIQLLPVLSYYYVDEMNKQRELEYSSSNNNYNWGYDPLNYFSLTGMYSLDPKNPEKRIEEFKNLVNEIHKRNMGVILDVVYNHTAKVDIFENLEPNYYHFMDQDGTPRTSFGGGRLGTTHFMSRKLLVDSIKYLVENYKVDGFRFDMMGDHDSETIELAFNEAKKINPNILMLGEGWLTFKGDENISVKAADQKWMKDTDTVAVFSDDIRNLLKSGFPHDGKPAFLTTQAQDIMKIFNNIKGNPTSFEADDPGDVIQYIAAHDNLTLFDVIAKAIKKDPTIKENELEIHKRLRLGNLLILTSQGTPFIHAGQEYGRTKQFKHKDYENMVSDDKVPNKADFLVNEDGSPFKYPYFIHDSYDSSDMINRFEWEKVRNVEKHPENIKTKEFTKELIKLRKLTDAFRYGTKQEIDKNVKLIVNPGENGLKEKDLVIVYQSKASNGKIYIVFVNLDNKERVIKIPNEFKHVLKSKTILETEQGSIKIDKNEISIKSLSGGILKY